MQTFGHAFRDRLHLRTQAHQIVQVTTEILAKCHPLSTTHFAEILQRRAERQLTQVPLSESIGLMFRRHQHPGLREDPA